MISLHTTYKITLRRGLLKKKLKLEKNEIIFLEDNKVYKITSGKIFLRNIFSNGKVINNEFPFIKNDLVGNWFNICNVYEELTKDLAIEVQAIEDTTFEVSCKNELLENLKNDTFGILQYLIEQLLKKYVMSICFHMYAKKGYILSVLLLHSDEIGNVPKELLNHEVFNLSRSQFFPTLSELKKDSLMTKTSKTVRLNRIKIEKYLELKY